MAKSQIKQLQLRKACYGTKEWSKNSGICRNCRLQESCGKIENKIKIRQVKTSVDAEQEF